MHRLFIGLTLCILPWLAVPLAAGTAPAPHTFVFGLLMVGPANDHGWSQAHYEAGREIEKQVPGTRMIYVDKVNPADRPGITIPMLVNDLVAKGARLIIANSDDMKDGIREATMMHPDVYFVHISGDDALTGKGGRNLSNLMGRMEYGKMMAGFVAAMTTRTGKIGYLGPLVNAETRRLAVSAYLGARYAWTRVLARPATDLHFKVAWIGFWFNIPGVTADPTLLARDFIDSGHDVLLSGIDTTEALIVASQARKQGKEAWAVPYNFRDACAEAPDACLGVPWFNWFPGYRILISQAMAGTWQPRFLWLGPDWKDINNPRTSSIGFTRGSALAPAVVQALTRFQQGLANGSINLFTGPLNLADGTVFLRSGETASDSQVWNLPQLLQGMNSD